MDKRNLTFINNPKYYLSVLLVSLIYFAVSRLSLLLAVGNTNVTSVWPPSGIALAVILTMGYRMGPAILIGAFFANILSLKGITPNFSYCMAFSLTTSIGNMLEGLTGAFFIRHFTGENDPFKKVRDLFVFIFFGGFISTMVSALIGVTSYSFISGEWSLFRTLLITWWMGDTAGILIVSPAIIMLYNGLRIKLEKKLGFEAIIIFSFLAIVVGLIFWNSYQLEYLVIPPLLWVSLRFGRFNTALAVIFVSGISILSTIMGTGPLTTLALNKSLLYLQSYIGVIAIITLCLSVLTYEHMKSEEMRSAVQKQLYDIIDFLPDATFAIDNSGKVIAWNKAIETITGISKKDMIGKGDYAYAIPFFGKPQPILIDLVMEDVTSSSLSTYDNIDKHKTTLYAERYNPILNRHLSGSASVLIDKDGKIYGAIESIRDISDRRIAELNLQHYKENLEEIVKERSASLLLTNEQLKREISERDRVEKALIESERKYRDLVESSNSVIIRWKPDGTVTFFNIFAQKFFGYSEDEILGKNIMGTIVPLRESSTGRDLSLLIEKIVNNPESHAFNENENIKKSGELVWIAWTNKPITNDTGTVLEILSVGIDITERKMVEKSLRNTLNELAIAKEKAESADRIKSAFLATMSHELRTPLNSIIGFTGVVLQKLAGPLTEEQTKQLGMVRSSAQHLLSLISDVLDISKIEAGQLELSAEVYDVKAIIDKVVTSIKPLADKKGLSLSVDTEPVMIKSVGDTRRIEQIILNLISNAIKFTDRGKITISAHIAPVQKPHYENTEAPSAYQAIFYRVTDTGIGIHPDNLEEIFQPFRQIDSGLSRKNEGTGLGLAICRKLATLMGGEITVESDLGKGSTFTFVVPK